MSSPRRTRTSPSPRRPTCSGRWALGLAKDQSYFDELARDLAQKRDLLSAGLARLGFGVLESRGSYFVTADFSPLGFAGDDVAFCKHITIDAGVTAIPVSAFYETEAPTHYARFAFCKRESVLAEAVGRLERTFADARLTRAS